MKVKIVSLRASEKTIKKLLKTNDVVIRDNRIWSHLVIKKKSIVDKVKELFNEHEIMSLKDSTIGKNIKAKLYLVFYDAKDVKKRLTQM